MDTGNTRIEEFIHIANARGGNEAFQVPEATFVSLASRLRGIKTLYQHQDLKHAKPLGDIIGNWEPTLEVTSFREGMNDMSNEDIRGLFIDAPYLSSFGCNRSSTGTVLRGQDLDDELKVLFEAGGKELVKAISPDGVEKRIDTLLFIVHPIGPNVSGCKEGIPEYSRRIEATKQVLLHMFMR
ncbi:hypothetical protein DPSP01_011620 [Paraphaeosphaeria sporulosa]